MKDLNSPSGVLGTYDGFVRILTAGQSVVLLLIRLYFGFICMRSGYRHLANFDKTVEAFVGWHVPMPKVNVVISGTTELVGGAMLMVGLFSRLISIPLIFNFLVAIVSVSLADPDYHDKILHFWNFPDVVLKDDAFPFLCTAVLVLFFGPGLLSVDALLRRVFYPKKTSTPSAFEVGNPRPS